MTWRDRKYYVFWEYVGRPRYPAFNAYAPYWLPHFSTLSLKRHDFRKTSVGYKTFVVILSTNFVWNISHSKGNWARYDQKCIFWSSCKVPVTLSDLHETWIFSKDFLERMKCRISLKSFPSEQNCSMRTEKRDTHDEANSRFSIFCERA
jgi:hypothetical protein